MIVTYNCLTGGRYFWVLIIYATCEWYLPNCTNFGAPVFLFGNRGAFDLEDCLYLNECPATTMFRSQHKYRAVRPVLTRWSRNGFQDRFLPTVRDKCESFVLKVSCQGWCWLAVYKHLSFKAGVHMPCVCLCVYLSLWVWKKIDCLSAQCARWNGPTVGK